jgi:hypothetical protein
MNNRRFARAVRGVAFLLVLIPCAHCLAQTQTDNDNHRKYWYYRSRLVNDFVKVGLGDGESMPFNQRGAAETESTGFADPNQNKLKLGDGASTLGYYIALLATEYHLLAANNANTAKVKHELFCTLNAINRLDYKAEGVYTWGTERLNGFFVRDDAAASLLTANFDHFNYYQSRGFMSKMQHPVTHVASDWEEAKANGKDIAMSQDQVYDLLFGLAFVSKLVPPTETDNNATFPYEPTVQTSLAQESRTIASRIINFIRVPTDQNGAQCGNPGNTWQNRWRIRNPTTCNLVSAGSDASAFAYPLSEINCQLSTQASPPGVSYELPPHSCNYFNIHYYDPFNLPQDFLVWNSAIKGLLVNPNNPAQWMDIRVFFSNLAAVGNCSYNDSVAVDTQVITTVQQIASVSWLGIFVEWVTTLFTQIIQVNVPIRLNSTAADIQVNAYVSTAPIDHAPLARAVLHGGAYQQRLGQSFLSLLAAAPCDDIYSFGPANQSTYEWSCDSRLDHPNRRGAHIDASNPFSGEYNGIDYMLYHNLWYTYQGQLGVLQQIADLSDIHIENGSYTGSSIDAYETVTIDNTVVSVTSPTYIRAGKSISFGPGTQISPGSNLHAYIEGYQCAIDTGHF